ncbi:MAG: hypothetical protein A3E57_02050 [Candidatus Muproteobacteria bacterium RIFCSPHIGHO2_12_FULL_60_33]|uniref:Uncharacterized protein n=1 Tax=Candidatus Muproteobacteria bacterium RIFCSPLOWO2_01_FULL_60_18 TaxID=1817768 RepID=A0A1F6U128_9PROT|nr:MAG: hypothetical protein A3A87_00105 [Candidatus Muproteobacteria bacterium RIFCSPLOWO2_01_FULL_60_18]OGI51637.1 MAG: hypothetical protein A2W42_03865 [Candidatus Muproteobacteria bacterium RIFCSPHIGHO2_01_60_12]OGI54637.1 MAG: hypothetical protein A3D32_03955 [Candidatus Muproteobacteria bacterium RIFCSPHIGHO2_02_FULL_60_13]OGI56149.1 MAG: hypothetical protein A3E57_02050 [Candidatus Muproteobacteria bacterium RIFCSPHIGHO2_12_FULL_60_33]OGI58863.1 MAG: hypothetical protein A2809_04260 [Can
MPLKKKVGILLGIGVAAAIIFGPLWWRPAVPCVAGDLTARAQAQVPDNLKEIYLDAWNMQFGLGSAAIGGWQGLGDAIAVGGLAWVRTTRADSPKYFATVSNRYFQSNGFVYIPLEREHESSFRLEQVAPLAQLWESLAKKYPQGVMFSGYVRLAPLRIIAIARPAIDGRAVLKNAPSYYTRPMESAQEAWAYVVGIATAKSTISRTNRAWLSSLLAARPDRAGNGVGLAHALWLKSAPADVQSPPARANVNAVGQLVADQTTLMEGELKLYPVTRASGCGDVARAR